ncbi:MAG: transporter [Acidobacteria bacterium]|nr:transporter [Acidobacteriota bacterium]
MSGMRTPRHIVVAAIVLGGIALTGAPASAGPITFLTALPVAQSQAVVRGQYLLMRASDNRTPADRELTVQAWPVAVAVGITPRLAVFGVVPFAAKSFEVNTPAGRRTFGTSGLGDIVVFGRFTAIAVDDVESTFRIAPFGGVKLPTGDADESDDLGRLPRPLQAGTGSWDALGGLAITFQTKQWQMDADVGFRRTTEADGFRFGDEAFADVSFQYRVWPRQLGAGVPAFLYAVAETNLISQGRHEIRGLADSDSGGTRWDVDVGLQYVTTNYIIEGIVQIPALDRPNGTGLRSDVRVTAGLRWNISLPF